MYNIVTFWENLSGNMWHITEPSTHVQRVMKWAILAELRPTKLLVTGGSLYEGLSDRSNAWMERYWFL